MHNLSPTTLIPRGQVLLPRPIDDTSNVSQLMLLPSLPAWLMLLKLWISRGGQKAGALDRHKSTHLSWSYNIGLPVFRFHLLRSNGRAWLIVQRRGICYNTMRKLTMCSSLQAEKLIDLSFNTSLLAIQHNYLQKYWPTYLFTDLFNQPTNRLRRRWLRRWW